MRRAILLWEAAFFRLHRPAWLDRCSGTFSCGRAGHATGSRSRSQAITSLKTHATRFGPMRLRRTNSPARSRRQIEVLERLVSSVTSRRPMRRSSSCASVFGCPPGASPAWAGECLRLMLLLRSQRGGGRCNAERLECGERERQDTTRNYCRMVCRMICRMIAG